MFDTDGFINEISRVITESGDKLKLSDEEMLGKLNEIMPDAFETQGEDFIVLAAMFVSGCELVPRVSRDLCGEYEYPVASQFMSEQVEKTLDLLRANGFLENGELVDRVRRCPACNSSYLNYIDVCPACKSIDFIKQELIHCFTCGRVAPSGLFRKGAALQCPFCTARLRHIGSDYDFPLENYICNSCSEIFIEPEVLVSCYSCGVRVTPDALLSRNIYKMKLSPKGRLAVRLGRIDAEERFVENENYLSPDSFFKAGAWMTMMLRRYKTDIFSLIGMKFDNLTEIADVLGSQRSMFMMDAIVERIRELLRDTDIITRTVQGFLWFLLPRTNASGVDVISQRLSEMGDITDLPDGMKLKISIEAHTFSESDGSEFDFVMKTLAEQLERGR